MKVGWWLDGGCIVGVMLTGWLLGWLCCGLAQWMLGETMIPRRRYWMAAWIMVAALVSLLLRFGVSWQLVSYGLLAGLLLTISLIDAAIWIIPDALLLTGLLCYLPLELLAGQSVSTALWQGLVGGCSVAVPLWLFVRAADHLLQKETMGGGDIKLLALLGVYLGPMLTVLTLFVSCLVGLLWQLVQQRLKPDRAFPFGPSIAVAAWVVVLWGQPLLRWYLELF